MTPLFELVKAIITILMVAGHPSTTQSQGVERSISAEEEARLIGQLAEAGIQDAILIVRPGIDDFINFPMSGLIECIALRPIGTRPKQIEFKVVGPETYAFAIRNGVDATEMEFISDGRVALFRSLRDLKNTTEERRPDVLLYFMQNTLMTCPSVLARHQPR
jgi:hypothetical protein